jgi:hypothetical protein
MPEMPSPYKDLDKKVLRFGVGLLLIGGVGFGMAWFIRRNIDHIQENSFDRKALDEGSAERAAVQLHTAFENNNLFGWGTDEVLVYQVFQQMDSYRFYEAVQRAYRNKYDRSLVDDLDSELGTDEKARVFAILDSKPRR